MLVLQGPDRVLTQRYVVEEGDTLEGITAKFGRPAWDYPALVAANLDQPRELSGRRAPPGLGPKFRLRPGERLRIPALWGCKPCRRAQVAPSLGVTPLHVFQNLDLFAQSASQVNDNTLNPVTLKLLEFVDAGMAGFLKYGGQEPDLPDAWRPGIANAVVAWWTQDHPNQVPEFGAFKPYFTSARRWMELYGSSMSDADAVPWSQIPFAAVDKHIDFLGEQWVNWPTVRAWLEANVAIEDLQSDPVPAGEGFHTNPFAWEQEPWTSWPWSWVPFGQIPFALVPWSKLTFQQAKAKAAQNAPGGQITAAVIAEIAAALGVPFSTLQPLPDGVTFDVTPGGALPHPTTPIDTPGSKPPPPPAQAPAAESSEWGKIAIGALIVTVVSTVAGAALNAALSPKKRKS